MADSNLGYPGSVWTPSLSFTPSLHTSRVRNSPNAVQVEWWRAIPDPTYDKAAGRTDPQAGSKEFVYERQDGDHWALLSNSPNMLKRFFADGVWDQGQVTIAFDPLELPLSIYDWVFPLGDGQESAILYNGRAYTNKETLVRGNTLLPGIGTVGTTGTAVVGAGTAFLSFVQVGDILTVGSDQRRITAVTDDTHISLESALPVDVAGRSFSKAVEYPRQSPLTGVTLLRDTAKTYTFGVDFTLSPKGDMVQWLSASSSPAPGSKYAIVYDYRPRYELTDLTRRGVVVRGIPLLSITVGSLWTPQDNLER